MVIWIFNNRIKDVENKMKTGTTYILAINKQNKSHEFTFTGLFQFPFKKRKSNY
jgi:hypothetical protein